MGRTRFQLRQGQKVKKFVFLAHWVEPWNWLLWWSTDLHHNPHHAWRWKALIPFYLLASIFYLIGRKSYDVVDRFHFNGFEGETWLIRNFGWHFFLKKRQEQIRQRILKAVVDAQDDGVAVIGLGALTKAEWLTEGGKWIVETLGPRLHVPVIHGDTLTAAAVYHRVIELRNRRNTYGPVFITGATSKIGRAVTLALVNDSVPVVMYTRSQKRFHEIQKEAGNAGSFLTQALTFHEGTKCALWITGKAESGSGKQLVKALPRGATVLNFSVPDPLNPSLLRARPDVRHYDGGVMGYDERKTNLRFTMRLKPGMTYACHAGTIVHAAHEWSCHEVGHVDVAAMAIVWDAAMDLGFYLPELTSFLRKVD